MFEEAQRYLPEIEANLRRLAQSPHDMDALETAYRLTHAIGGAASIRNVRDLAYLAHGMEDMLGDGVDGLAILDAAAIGLLMRDLGRLRRFLRSIQEGIDEDALIIAEADADYRQYRLSQDAK